MNKKVSVIIPCYNQGQYVKEAIESALVQTYKNLEIIVVDDASSDNSRELIENYTNQNENIKFIKNSKNQGASYSRNIAIENACGEYILPLDADDKIHPSYVEKAVKILEENHKIGIVYCDAELFGAQEGKWMLQEYNKDSFIFANCIFCSALFRKEVWEKAGKYNENMKSGYEDWDFWLSIVELGYEVYKIPEILFYYRKHTVASMTTKAFDNSCSVCRQLFKNHLDFYLSNDLTIKKIYESVSKKTYEATREKLERYRKLFRIFLISSIVLAVLLFILIAVFIFLK